MLRYVLLIDQLSEAEDGYGSRICCVGYADSTESRQVQRILIRFAEGLSLVWQFFERLWSGWSVELSCPSTQNHKKRTERLLSMHGPIST